MSASAVKAGQAYVEIATRQNLLNRGLAAAAARIGSFGKTLGSIGSGIFERLNFAGPLLLLPGLLGVVKTAFGGLISVLTFVVSAFVSVISTIVSFLAWPALIIAAVAGLGAAILYYTGTGADALALFGQAWQWLLETVMPVIQAILNAMMSGDFTRAGEILWTSLQLIWYTGIQSLYNMWLDFKAAFLNAIDPFIQPLMEIWSAVSEAASIAFNGIKWLWDSTFGAMLTSFNSIQMSWGDMIQNMSDMWNDTVNWIAKKLLYLYSLFDWSVDYEAAAKDMDAQNEAKKKANRQQRQQRTEARKEEAEVMKNVFSDEITALRKQLETDMAGVSKEGFQLKMPEGLSGFADKAQELIKSLLQAIPLIDKTIATPQATFSGFAAMNITGQTSDKAYEQRAAMLRALEQEKVLASNQVAVLKEILDRQGAKSG